MSAPDRIWAAPGKYGWADGLCGDRPSPANPDDTAYLLDTPARRHAAELEEALREIDKWSRRQNIALPTGKTYAALAKLEEET